MLTPLQQFVLHIMLLNNGESDLVTLRSLVEKRESYAPGNWTTHESGLFKWEYELRAGYQGLCDLGLVTGGEFGRWELTDNGVVGALGVPTKGVVHQVSPPQEEATPRPIRTTSLVSKILRDHPLATHLKELYEYRCQVCGTSLRSAMNTGFAEAHHIIPLGSPHDGPDVTENIIVLCPNHHFEFDSASISLNPETRLIEHIVPADKIVGRSLLQERHEISESSLIYHYNRFTARKIAQSFLPW